jgi:DNA-directed RNA polymerase
MGPDFAKGMLRFSRSAKVASDDETAWLFIHGANCFGIKGTYEDRIRWVDSNKKHILNVAHRSPDLDFLREADEPFQFAAFAWEYRKLHETWQQGFETTLPCQMDASNNGLQILGMLMRDRGSCEATNVAANATPQDIYQRVMDEAIRVIELDASDISLPFATKWLQFGLDRGCANFLMIRRPPRSTRHSCRAYVNQWYLDKVRDGKPDPFGPDNRFEACSYLSQHVWRAIEVVVGKPREAMSWLQKAARILVDHDKPMEWLTPSGFPVMQAYEKFAEKSIRTKVGERVFRVKFREDMGKLSPRRQAQGSSPNFVHSLDASVLHKTVNSCGAKGISSFAMVHDSYGTHAPNCNIMADSVRENVYDIFSLDQLGAFRQQLMMTNEIELPELPEYGDFDMSEVLNSLYMFS